MGGVDSYGADTPINLLTILDSNGIEDTLWCLRATIEPVDRFARHFAADCAADVLDVFERAYPGDDRPRKAIRAAHAFADGLIAADDLRAAEAAVRVAASEAWGSAVASAANAAAVAAAVAADAAEAAVSGRAGRAAIAASEAWGSAREAQIERLRSMLKDN